MASSPFRLLTIRSLSFVSALVLLAGAALPAPAQTVVGTVPRPAVTVDLSVLDSLGPEPTLPDLLRGRTPPGARTAARRARPRRITLHPPKAKKKALAKAAPKAETAAARPAAAIAPVAASGAAVPRESVAATPLAEPPPSQPAPAAAAPTAPPAPVPAAPQAAAPAAAPEAPAAASASPTAPSPPAKPVAAAAPITPTVAPPTPVPTVAPPPPAAATAMNAPPSLPPAAPVKASPAAAPADMAAAGKPARILFGSTGADLPDGAKSALDAMARRLATDAHLRLQLVAYASGTADQANQARRVSLQRALAVRSYLMEHGVANTRMDVRALGNRNESGEPPDRVDLVLLEH